MLRIREGVTQTAVSKREGAPDFRTLSHWENGRKQPGAVLLRSYLASMGLDYHDLQEALDQLEGAIPKQVQDGLAEHERRIEALERHLGLEAKPPAEGAGEGETSLPAEAVTLDP